MRITYQTNTTANYSQGTNSPLEPVLSNAEAGELEGAFNRYSYVINNPLKYTDPSGEAWGDIFKKWHHYLNPVNYLSAVVDYANHLTTPQRRAAVNAGVPDFGVSISGNGTNQYSIGIGIGTVETKTVYNSDYAKSVPGINWGLVDAMRFPNDYGLSDYLDDYSWMQNITLGTGIGAQIGEDLFEYGANVPLKGAENANRIKEAAAATSFKTVSKYMGRIGLVANTVVMSTGSYKVFNSNRSYGDIGKLRINAASIGLTYMGRAFTVLGIGLGIWDATGNADWFYYGLDFHQSENTWFGRREKGYYYFGKDDPFMNSSFKPK